METQLQASRTPILDCEKPLPKPTATGAGSEFMLVGWMLLIVGIAAAWIFRHPAAGESLQQFIAADLAPIRSGGISAEIVALALTVLAVFAVVAIHELGHVLGGLCAGFRFNSIGVGPFELHRPFRFSVHSRAGKWSGGWVNTYPAKSDHLAARGLLLVISGPVASVLAGCIVLLLPFSKGLVSHIFILASIVGGLGDLLPFRTPTGVSDGGRIWMLLQKGRGERWVALMKLVAELGEGVMPESLSPQYIEKAIAPRDKSADTVNAYSIAYSSAFHRHNDAQAAALLETCLAYSGFAAPATREALMSDAAVFQARRKKRADLAEQWLANMPAATQLPGLRARTEAAILETRGEIAAALRALETYEKAVLTLANPVSREITTRFVARWKSELR